MELDFTEPTIALQAVNLFAGPFASNVRHDDKGALICDLHCSIRTGTEPIRTYWCGSFNPNSNPVDVHGRYLLSFTPEDNADDGALQINFFTKSKVDRAIRVARGTPIEASDS